MYACFFTPTCLYLIIIYLFICITKLQWGFKEIKTYLMRVCRCCLQMVHLYHLYAGFIALRMMVLCLSQIAMAYWLLNFGQYGQMENQRWEESEREEERRWEKRKSQKKEDAGARIGRKVTTHCVFPWFVAPEGRKVGSLKRQVRRHLARWDEKLHAVVARTKFGSQNAQSTSCSDSRKSARRCGVKHISKSKVEITEGFGALLDVRMSFCVVGTRDSAPCQKWRKRGVL